MTRYAFTGPSSLSDADAALARDTVRGLDDPGEITTGAATGWDTTVCLLAMVAWPQAVHRIITPGAKFNLVGVNHAIGLAKHMKLERFEVITLAAPFKGGPSAAYRERNRQMVEACDVLAAGVRVPTALFCPHCKRVTERNAQVPGLRSCYHAVDHPGKAPWHSDDEEPVFYRSGEWMTVNLARASGRPVQFTRLPPTT